MERPAPSTPRASMGKASRARSISIIDVRGGLQFVYYAFPRCGRGKTVPELPVPDPRMRS